MFYPSCEYATFRRQALNELAKYGIEKRVQPANISLIITICIHKPVDRLRSSSITRAWTIYLLSVDLTVEELLAWFA